VASRWTFVNLTSKKFTLPLLTFRCQNPDKINVLGGSTDAPDALEILEVTFSLEVVVLADADWEAVGNVTFG
jgi:hypothetical protein